MQVGARGGEDGAEPGEIGQAAERAQLIAQAVELVGIGERRRLPLGGGDEAAAQAVGGGKSVDRDD